MKPMEVVIIKDSREQDGFDFEGAIVKGLNSGDYSLFGYENEICIERKSVPDACSSVIRDRERFEREMIRAMELQYFAIVIEGTQEDLKQHILKEWNINNRTSEEKQKNYGRLKGQLKSVINTFIHWSVKYNYPVFFCKNKLEAKNVTFELLMAYAKYKARKEKEVKSNGL